MAAHRRTLIRSDELSPFNQFVFHLLHRTNRHLGTMNNIYRMNIGTGIYYLLETQYQTRSHKFPNSALWVCACSLCTGQVPAFCPVKAEDIHFHNEQCIPSFTSPPLLLYCFIYTRRASSSLGYQGVS